MPDNIVVLLVLVLVSLVLLLVVVVVVEGGEGEEGLLLLCCWSHSQSLFLVLKRVSVGVSGFAWFRTLHGRFSLVSGIVDRFLGQQRCVHMSSV